jgi:hypothetical protein
VSANTIAAVLLKEPKETGWHDFFFGGGGVFMHRVIVEEVRRLGIGLFLLLRAQKTPVLGDPLDIVGVFLA